MYCTHLPLPSTLFEILKSSSGWTFPCQNVNSANVPEEYVHNGPVLCVLYRSMIHSRLSTILQLVCSVRTMHQESSIRLPIPSNQLFRPSSIFRVRSNLFWISYPAQRIFDANPISSFVIVSTVYGVFFDATQSHRDLCVLAEEVGGDSLAPTRGLRAELFGWELFG